MMAWRREAVPVDYDSDPGRRQRTVRASERYRVSGNVYATAAAMFRAAGVKKVLDVRGNRSRSL